MLSLYKFIQTNVYHKQNKIHPTSTHCNLKEAMQRKSLFIKYLKIERTASQRGSNHAAIFKLLANTYIPDWPWSDVQNKKYRNK